MSKLTDAPAAWPKSYLLQVYSRTISEGCVRIQLPNEKAFRSFSQALYRLRRRSDAQHAAFILPEYHLVTCAWEPERSAALVTFDALPDGVELPVIEAVDINEQRIPLPVRVEQAPKELEEAPLDLEQLIGDIVEEAGKKVDDSGL